MSNLDHFLYIRIFGSLNVGYNMLNVYFISDLFERNVWFCFDNVVINSIFTF